MSTVYMTIGYTGSGKSTFARNFIKTYLETVIVSPDAFRKMLNGQYKYDVQQDDLITELCFITAVICLHREKNVIIDACNLNKSPDRRGKWCRLRTKDVRLIALVFPTDKDIEWYYERRMKDPHWDKDWKYIITKQMKAYEPPTLDEFDEIFYVDENGERK